METLTNKQIIEQIKKMTVMQVNELVELIQTTFNVTAAVASLPAATQEVVATTPSTVSITLKEVEFSKRMTVIKELKAILGDGVSLVAAKKIIDAVAEKPQTILENIDATIAADYESKLQKAGAVVEVK